MIRIHGEDALEDQRGEVRAAGFQGGDAEEIVEVLAPGEAELVRREQAPGFVGLATDDQLFGLAEIRPRGLGSG
ncbi:MAG: hypothetical protein EXR31_07130 [Betaproteobacteria bacterium]|nr:hypothetical protein [Betaproteobacteria bacterium]